MTPDGLITSEFDDAATIDPLARAGSRNWDDDDDDLDDGYDAFDDDDVDEVAAEPTGQGDELDDDDDLIDLELVVLDLAGTTVVDDRPAELDALLAAEDAGSGETEEVSTEGLRPVPGAEELIHRLRGLGVKVALTTGFSRATHDAVLDALGWRDVADLTLSTAEAGRGRPYPDLPLTALLRAGATSVDGMVVVGDTAGDIASGIAAGAGLVVGVLTGADDEQTLLDAGADAVIPSIADLPELLGLDDPEGPGGR